VSQLQGKTYCWKKDAPLYSEEDAKGRRVIGLIAQEVQKVLPDVVNEDENGVLSVAYTELIPLLIEAFNQHVREYNEDKKRAQTSFEQFKEEVRIHIQQTKVDTAQRYAGGEHDVESLLPSKPSKEEQGKLPSGEDQGKGRGLGPCTASCTAKGLLGQRHGRLWSFGSIALICMLVLACGLVIGVMYGARTTKNHPNVPPGSSWVRWFSHLRHKHIDPNTHSKRHGDDHELNRHSSDRNGDSYANGPLSKEATETTTTAGKHRHHRPHHKKNGFDANKDSGDYTNDDAYGDRMDVFIGDENQNHHVRIEHNGNKKHDGDHGFKEQNKYNAAHTKEEGEEDEEKEKWRKQRADDRRRPNE